MKIFLKYIQNTDILLILKRFSFLLLVILFTFFFFLKIPSSDISATNVLTNPSFTGGSTSWTLSRSGSFMTIAYNATNYQDTAGSVETKTLGKSKSGTSTTTQTTSSTITAGNSTTLTFYYNRPLSYGNCLTNTITAKIQPTGGTESTVWTSTDTQDVPSWPSVSALDITSYITTTATYILTFTVTQTTAANTNSYCYTYIDNVNLDVTPPTLTVGTTGTQITSTNANTSNLYIGGAFQFSSNASQTMSSITISQTGTISDSNISGLILYFKDEAVCSTSFPSGTIQFNSTPGTFSSGSSTVTGTKSFNTFANPCMYIEVDIGSASNGNTIELQITNPSTQITVDVGNVSPATAVAISGTTTIGTNNAPSFTAYSNNGPVNPGSSITFSTTASDPDGDNITLVVCKTQGVTGTACDGGSGDTWSTSSAVASNPSCQFSVPSVFPDDTYNTYPYVFDSQSEPATGSYQGVLSTFVVNNVAPTVSAVTINGGTAISLESATTKAVTLTATISDNNSCYGTEISSVIGYVYRSGIGYTGCDSVGEANNNYCYPQITCTVVGGSCTDSTDASANYTCSASIYYYADPTGTDTQYPSDTWMDTIKATDDDSSTDSLQVSIGVQMNMLEAMSITSSINYGTLSVESGNDPLDRTTTSTPTGNVGLDHEIYGTDMCTDYPGCAASKILVANQKYALTASTSYSSATALSTTPTPVSIDISKPITGSPATKNMWWGMYAPLNTSPGSYTGTINITAFASNPSNW